MKTAILIVDHGSHRPEANAVLEEIAAQVREKFPEFVVHTAHMDLGKPDIATGVQSCLDEGARRLIVQPYFLGPGNHVMVDIPNQVEKALGSCPDVEVRVTQPLGVDPRLADVVADRVRASLVDGNPKKNPDS